MRKIIIPAVFILIAVSVAALVAGNGAISTADIFRVLAGGGSSTQKIIVYQVRIPRLVATVSVGAALSVSGYLLQNSLDNLIASPGLLGINHGAGLFVLICALLFPHRNSLKCLMAFGGALLVTLLVYILTAVTGMAASSVILSGVAVTAACTALTDMIISFRPETVADKAAFQLGGFASVSVYTVYIAVPVIAVCLAVTVYTAPSLDIMALGDETAQGLGLNVKTYRGIHIICAALLAGASVSLCGLVGFVGLMVPNIIRLVYNGNSRMSVLLNMAAGSAFLTVCDTAARLIAFPYELPCGLILSCIGAPFLVCILFRKRKRLGMS